jgi:serine kinase of HPr protein (carbohydrate metabolism regulator)
MSAAPPFAHQATCVAISGKALLIEGPPGSGKSSLALALIDRGAVLLGDDGVMLAVQEDRLVARPHPNTRGLLEVRGLGLLPFAVAEEAPVALFLRLDAAAPRFIEAAQNITLGGVTLPLIQLWPDAPALPLRAELALAHYGLS